MDTINIDTSSPIGPILGPPAKIELIPITVSVRWHDGYIEQFKVNEVRAGCDLLWLRLANNKERNIPLRSVRWFSRSVESHEETP